MYVRLHESINQSLLESRTLSCDALAKFAATIEPNYTEKRTVEVFNIANTTESPYRNGVSRGFRAFSNGVILQPRESLI